MVGLASQAAEGTLVSGCGDATQTGVGDGGGSASTGPASGGPALRSQLLTARGCPSGPGAPAAHPEPHSPAPGGASAGPRSLHSASVSSWAWHLEDSRPGQPGTDWGPRGGLVQATGFSGDGQGVSLHPGDWQGNVHLTVPCRSRHSVRMTLHPRRTSSWEWGWGRLPRAWAGSGLGAPYRSSV